MRSFWLIITTVFLMAGCKQDTSSTALTTTGDPQIDALSTEIQKNPKDPMLLYQRAKLFYDKDKMSSAILDLQAAMKIDSVNPNFYHLLSDAHLANFNSDDAIMDLYKVLKLYPNRPQTMLKLAELKVIIEDYDGSILVLNDLIKVDNQNAEAYYMLGVNFKALGDNKRAAASFQTAVEMNSKLSDGWIGLGEIAEANKDPKALGFYDNAILSDPTAMNAVHSKAFYLQNNNKIADAKSLYRQIIVTDRNYEAAYLNLGLLYMEEDSFDLAYEHFNNLASISPTEYRGFYYRAMANEKRGKIAEAIKDLKSAKNLFDKDPKIDEALTRLETTKK